MLSSKSHNKNPASTTSSDSPTTPSRMMPHPIIYECVFVFVCLRGVSHIYLMLQTIILFSNRRIPFLSHAPQSRDQYGISLCIYLKHGWAKLLYDVNLNHRG